MKGLVKERTKCSLRAGAAIETTPELVPARITMASPLPYSAGQL